MFCVRRTEFSPKETAANLSILCVWWGGGGLLTYGAHSPRGLRGLRLSYPRPYFCLINVFVTIIISIVTICARLTLILIACG